MVKRPRARMITNTRRVCSQFSCNAPNHIAGWRSRYRIASLWRTLSSVVRQPDLMRATRTRLVIVAYVLGILGIHGVVLWNARSLIRKGYADFTIDYCAGTMVRDGLGHQLYDLRAQNEVKHRFAPSVAVHPGELPYNHPPFEALFFLPFSYAPYLTAFVLWDLLNLGLLLAIAFLLRDCFAGVPSDSWKFFLPVSLVFFPVFFNLLQGQD